MTELDGWGFVYNRNFIYNPNTLAWEAETQPSTGAGGGNSTVIQGTSPWIIAGNSTVFQGSTSWQVQVTNQIKVTNSTASDFNVNISGNSTVMQGTNPWLVGGNSSIRANLSSSGADNPVVVSAFTPTKLNIGSTAADNAVLVSGNSTVAPLAGSLWTIQGNSTVMQSSSWQVTVTNQGFGLIGNSSVLQASSNWQVQVTNQARVTNSSAGDFLATISGNSTVVISAGNSSVIITSFTPTKLNIGSTAADNAVLISGNSTVFQGSTAWQVQVTNQVKVVNSTASDFNVTVAGNSTVAPLAGSLWTIQGNSTVFQAAGSTWNVRAQNSSAVDLKTQAWQFDGVGNAVESATNSGSVVNSTRRSMSVRETIPDCTNATGIAATAGDNTIFSSVAATVFYVYAYALQYASTIGGYNLGRFQSGTTNTLWTIKMGMDRAGPGTTTSMPIQSLCYSLSVPPPAYLFKTAAGALLNLATPSSGVNYAVAAWKE